MMDGKKSKKKNMNESELLLRTRLISSYFSITAALIFFYESFKGLYDGEYIKAIILFIAFIASIWDSVTKFGDDWYLMGLNDYNINEVMPSFGYVVFTIIYDAIALAYFAISIGAELSYIYIVDYMQILNIIILSFMIVIFVVKFITNAVSMIQYDMIYDDREWEDYDYERSNETESDNKDDERSKGIDDRADGTDDSDSGIVDSDGDDK